MASLHGGLKGFAVYLILTSVYWGVISRKKGASRAWCVRFLFAGFLVAGVIMLTQKMGWYLTVEQGLKSVEDFRISAVAIAEDNRAFYGVMLDTSSVLGIVKTISMIFVQFMFAPFPWQVENVKDIYAMLESILRFVLLFFAFSSWRRSSGEVRSCYGFLLISVLSMEFLWALGTINWGTAIRHHVPGYSVLVLLGGPGLILFMRKIHIGLFGRGKVNTMLLK
jgi:hypothetical protein